MIDYRLSNDEEGLNLQKLYSDILKSNTKDKLSAAIYRIKKLT